MKALVRLRAKWEAWLDKPNNGQLMFGIALLFAFFALGVLLKTYPGILITIVAVSSAIEITYMAWHYFVKREFKSLL